MPKLDLSDIGIDLRKTAERIKNEISLLSNEEQKEIKQKSGLSPQQFSNYFGKGKSKKDPSLEVIVKLAYIFEKSMDYFLYDKYTDIEENPYCVKIPYVLPLLDKDHNLIINGERCFYLHKNFIEAKKLYCLKIEGNMMHPTLSENDLVIIDYELKKSINEGKIHVFFSKKVPFVQVKRLFIHRDKIMVKPDNKDYAPYLIDLDQITIIGHGIKVYKTLN